MSELNEQLSKQEGRTPWFLYDFYLDDSNIIRFTNSEQDVTFDGNNYSRFPISIPSLSSNSEGKIDSIKVTISNVDRIIQSYAENYNGFRGCKVVIHLVFPDLIDQPDYAVNEEYYVSICELSAKTADFTLKPKINFLDIKIPRRIFSKYRCQWIFKSDECGYSGSETSCDKTFETCKNYGNQSRFGGFPAIPAGKLIRI